MKTAWGVSELKNNYKESYSLLIVIPNQYIWSFVFNYVHCCPSSKGFCVQIIYIIPGTKFVFLQGGGATDQYWKSLPAVYTIISI